MASNSDLITYGNLSTFKNNLVTFTDGKYMQIGTYVDTVTTKIKADVLPSFVDDVVDVHVDLTTPATPVVYADNNGSRGTQITTGEKDKIYVDLDATVDGIYRWSGTKFVAVNSSVSTADKALKDGSGNTITETYATKTELNNSTGTKASTTAYGIVKIGSNISVSDGVISVPAATSSALGVVKVGSNISVNSGTISVPAATTSALGVVKVGSNIAVASGVISVAKASASTLGVVKIGDGVNVDANGVISIACSDGITLDSNTVKPVVATTADINALFA